MSVNQFWCRSFMIKDVLNDIGDSKSTTDYIQGQCPVFFQLTALKNAIEDYISEYKNRCGRTYMDCIGETRPTISNYNIYGQIVYKKAKCCSHLAGQLLAMEFKET